MAEHAVNLRVLTNSEASAFQRCNRLWHYAYNLGRRPITTAHALTFGTVMHSGLEALHGGGSWKDAITGRLEDPYEMAKLTAMLTVYEIRWADDGIDWFNLETEIGCSLVNPETGGVSKTYKFGGKQDGEFLDRNGDLWIGDHKSTSSPLELGSAHLEQARMLPQGFRYVAAARAHGKGAYDKEVKGFMLNYLRKPRLKPRMATPLDKRRRNKNGQYHAKTRLVDETPQEYFKRMVETITENIEEYYARVWVPVTDDDLSESQYDLWQVAKAMMDARRLERYPRNANSCFNFQRPCDYWQVCSERADLDDDSIYRTASRRHEELAK